jgi:hypothetical protein
LIFAEPVTIVKPTSNGKPAAAKTTRRRRGNRIPEIVHAPHPDSPRLGQALSWPLQDILSLVAQNFLPAHAFSHMKIKTPSDPSRVCGSWIEVVPDLAITGPQGIALSSSIKAFAVAIMSYGLPDAASTIDALAAHGIALSSLKQALTSYQKEGSNEFSAAIMFLFLSEVGIFLHLCYHLPSTQECANGSQASSTRHQKYRHPRGRTVTPHAVERTRVL